MIFSIVIPAYNEEEAVQDVLRRCLDAASKLRASGLGVKDVEVILVDDGSTDRTAELARRVEGVRVLAHPGNRGYGAAIKTGFESARGGLLGFLDADGTCDPAFFADLIGLLQKEGLDAAAGSRMHPGSRMPPLRRAGNRLFRGIVNFIAGSSVADVASGMRVVRREALARLYPLPDGLDFTPAMSVRTSLDRRLKAGELAMPYVERVGRSKLRVVSDGLRFLAAIVGTALTYRPLFFFGLGSLLAAALAAWSLASPWGAPHSPLSFYWEHGRLEDWMIFRLILVTFLLAVSAFLAALGAVAQALVGIINGDAGPAGGERAVRLPLSRRLFLWGAAGLASSLVLNRRVLAVYWKTGHIPSEWWVFPLVGVLFALVGCEFVAFGLVDRIASLLRERERHRSGTRP